MPVRAPHICAKALEQKGFKKKKNPENENEDVERSDLLFSLEILLINFATVRNRNILRSQRCYPLSGPLQKIMSDAALDLLPSREAPKTVRIVGINYETGSFESFGALTGQTTVLGREDPELDF